MTGTGGVTRWRKKPVVIEAMHLTEETGPAVWEWAESKPHYDVDGKVDGLSIFTLEGRMKADFGDWIIKGVKGEFYPCRSDIFAATYEPATEKALSEVGEVARLKAELSRAQSAARTLGKVITRMAQSMEAARIEMIQNGPEAAMQWILNSLPDVSDEAPEDQWDGKETATQWIDRTQRAEAAGDPR